MVIVLVFYIQIGLMDVINSSVRKTFESKVGLNAADKSIETVWDGQTLESTRPKFRLH